MASESSEGAADTTKVVVLGRLVGAFGVSGWLKVVSYTDPVDNILNYPVWLLGRAGQWRPHKVLDGQITGKGVLAQIEGFGSREQAQGASGIEIAVARRELPPPAPGEYYWSDLEGLQAVSPQGEVLGIVDHFRTSRANPIMVIRGERQHLVPMVPERIVSVDLTAGRIVLDWGPDW